MITVSTDEAVRETTGTELVSGNISAIDEVKTSTIEEVKISEIEDTLRAGVATELNVGEDIGKRSSEEESVGERDGTGVGVNTLIDRLSSEEDMGISMLFEDICTRELELTAVSVTRVVSNPDERLGVGSTVCVNTSELSITAKEDSGISTLVEGSSVVVVGTGTSCVERDCVGTADVGSNDTPGVRNTSVDTSGSSMSELNPGSCRDPVISWVVSVGERLREGERVRVLVSGTRSTSELLTKTVRLLTGRDVVGVGVMRSSMLDCTVNMWEGDGESVRVGISVKTGRDVRADCTENIRDRTGIDDTAISGPSCELAKLPVEVGCIWG